MTGLGFAVGEELPSAFEPCFTKLSGIAEHPAMADPLPITSG